MNKQMLSTLFVGIDVSLRSNYAVILDFFGQKLSSLPFNNNASGASVIISEIIKHASSTKATHVVVAMESTSFYSFHLCNYIFQDPELAIFNTKVYCLNPKVTKAYQDTFVDVDKTDPNDAYGIADFARTGKITSEPFNGSQFIALQRLTRARLHLIEGLAREKSYVLTNIFIKFSELAVLSPKDNDGNPFSDRFGVTSIAVISEFMSPDEIAYTSLDDLIDFLVAKGKGRFKDPTAKAKLLQKAARDSYRLDKALYDPLNAAIAASFNCIKSFEKEIKLIDTAIEKAVKGLSSNEYQCLLSIHGFGPVISAGIIAEIGFVNRFSSEEKLAKFAGLTWRKKQSGRFTSDITYMTKSGNQYLRYYLGEGVMSLLKNHNPEYTVFYNKKRNEAIRFQHKRALALTSRKLVRLIFALLRNNQLYISKKGVVETLN
jgi:transposase